MPFPFSFWKSSAAAFTPASLSLSGWWRAGNYSSGTWTGTASAGASSGRNLVEATNKPTAGTSLNGFTAVAFARASSQKLDSALAISSFVTASQWSACALVKINSEDTDNIPAGAYDNDAIFSDIGGSYWSGIALRTTGPKAQAYQFASSANAAEATFTNGVWQFLQTKYDGTNVSVRVNGGSFVNVAQGNIANLTFLLRMGANYSAAAFIDGEIAEAATSTALLTTTDFDNWRAYLGTRYGVSV